MRKNYLIGIASLSLLALPGIALSDEAKDLKSIMQGLRDSLVEIADGLLTDNFGQIARGGADIANHPKIPAAKAQLVAAELGPEMAAFKQLDSRVHDLSLEIAAAAVAQDREAAARGYIEVVEGCLECHRRYKTRVAEALLGAPKTRSDVQ